VSCRIQPQATHKKAQEVAGLQTQKEVLARALFLGCTVVAFAMYLSSVLVVEANSLFADQRMTKQ